MTTKQKISELEKRIEILESEISKLRGRYHPAPVESPEYYEERNREEIVRQIRIHSGG